MTPPLALTPAMADRLARWLEGEAAARDRSAHTITAYRDDAVAFLTFLGGYHGAGATPASLGGVTQTDMRAFAAAERARGLSARSLATGTSATQVPSSQPWVQLRGPGAAPSRAPGSSTFGVSGNSSSVWPRSSGGRPTTRTVTRSPPSW